MRPGRVLGRGVDVDTLWRNRLDGGDFHWFGRACKVYARVRGEWKMTMHTGLLLCPPGGRDA